MVRSRPPIHAQIEADLRRGIADGRWGVGMQIPSEEELRQRYGVSRMTVRQALERLANAGLLVKRQGVGTFVAAEKLERVANSLLGFHEDAVAHGLVPKTRVLSVEFERLGTDDGKLLELPERSEVLRVKRVRSADGEPIGLNTITVVPAFARELADLDYAASFYQGVEQRLGVAVGEASQTVEAVDGGGGAAELLQVPTTRPLLRVTRITYLADGSLLGLTRSLYRGDRYYLSLIVRRTEPVMSA